MKGTTWCHLHSVAQANNRKEVSFRQMCVMPAENLKFEALLCKIFWLSDFKQALLSSTLDYPPTNHRYLSIKLRIIKKESQCSSAVKWEKINERNNLVPSPLRSRQAWRKEVSFRQMCIMPAENLKFESLLCKIFWLPDFKQPLESSALDYPPTNHRYLSIKLSVVQTNVFYISRKLKIVMLPFPLIFSLFALTHFNLAE